MTMPVVPFQNPGQSQINLPRVINPYTGIWWSTQSQSGVPEHIMGWMVAQGYEVVGVSQDETTVPPTNYYSLTKEGMKPLQVLLSLCNSYTIAANDARDANEIRYNQVVSNWTDMVSSSQLQFDAQTTEQNTQAAVYLGDLNTYMSAIEALIDENKTQIVIDAQAAKTTLDEMNTRLGDLESNAQNSAAIIGNLLSDQVAYLNTFLTDFSTKLNQLDQNFADHLSSVLTNVSDLGAAGESHITAYESQFVTLASNYTSHAATLNGLLTTSSTNTNTFVSDIGSLLSSLASDYTTVAATLDSFTATAGTLVGSHATDYSSVLALLESDYTTHVSTASGFLTGLGTTELARINEQFAAALSVQTQDLINNGQYKSVIITDIRARNHRDRDEQIQLLNDRLNREKLDNQHKTYDQQVSMRARTLDGKDRLHGVQQEVLRYRAAQVSGIYALLQESRNRTIQGKQAILTAQDANTKLGIDVQSGLYAKLQDVRMRTIEAADRIYQIRDVFAKWKNGETHQLFGQLQRIQEQHLAGIDKQHALQQEISRIGMTQRDSLLSQLQEALKGILTGKERYSSVLMQNASTLADHKHRAIAERMNTVVQRLEGWKMISDQNRILMQYQLDTRNNLLTGLYSFAERRDDIAPEWSEMSKMIAGLGDAGGGWLQP